MNGYTFQKRKENAKGLLKAHFFLFILTSVKSGSVVESVMSDRHCGLGRSQNVVIVVRTCVILFIPFTMSILLLGYAPC